MRAAVTALALSGCAMSGAAAPPPSLPDSHVASGPQGRTGQFVVECGWSHSSFDDPIVHAGRAGASHRHDFFGSTGTAAGSTYQQLVDGDTTCQQRRDTAAYWTPSVLDAEGAPVRPVRSVAYYRAGDGVDPVTVQAYPAGLMMVAGDASATSARRDVVAWVCGAESGPSPAPMACADGVAVRLIVTFPDCWDGVHRDSHDHRSHVAYSEHGTCDGEHPVPIPQLHFVVDYGAIATAGLTLSSGPITSAHGDFWNTWDQAKLEQEVELCIRQQNVCGVSS